MPAKPALTLVKASPSILRNQQILVALRRVLALQQVAKEKPGRVKWQARLFNKVLGDGHMIAIASKTEHKETNGDSFDD